MTKWEKIQRATLKKLLDLKLPPEYKERLVFEFKEIDKQGANDYWLDLIESNAKYDHNDNGLVLPWLLGITDIDPIENNIPHNIEYQPDFPDIDLDFLPIARAPVREYATEKYGADKVCAIGSWSTYKPKSALQDAARALGKDVGPVIELTKNLEKEFDDMPYEEALLEYPEFRAFAEENSDIVDIAYRMLGMIKTQGRHAGGVIISSVPVKEHIPLTLRNDVWMSAWTEGSSTQLSKFGFIKFDLLGLKNLQFIYQAGKLIESNRGLIVDWEDMDPEVDRAGWLYNPDGSRNPILFNDEDTIEAANQAKVDSIFQLETDLAKSILYKGGVKSFNDLVVYTSLGRPGPLPMIDSYIENRDSGKDWREDMHPMMADILEKTHGIICFQEQLASAWQKLAGFTAPEAEAARKAVAKKWVDKLEPIEQKWLEGASKTLGRKKAEEWWERMVTFGRYAFNVCLDKDTPLTDANTGITKSVEEWYESGQQLSILSYKDNEVVIDDVANIHDSGELDVYEVKFEDGTSECVTLNHKFLCVDGEYHELQEIINKGLEIISVETSECI